jgi:hypothetical protein
MPTTPAWRAAKNGIPGHLESTNQSAQVNQLLGAHQIDRVYQGTPILASDGGTQFEWLSYGNTYDLSQPFTLSGTTVGRVVLPVLPVGSGADTTVTLYPDNGSGSPLLTSPLASANLPAEIAGALSAVNGLENATGPLQTPWCNTLFGTGGIVTEPWAGPTGDSSGVATNSSITVSGNYFIYVGGDTTVPVAGVSTAQYLGSNLMAQGVAQPALPQACFFPAVTTTSSSIIVMGGSTAASSLTDVWVASWDPSTGLIGSWSQQTALPVALDGSASATWNNDTVYLVGGQNNAGTPVNTVYTTSVSNGQLGSWSAGPGLPTAVMNPFAAVFGDTLVVVGGQNPLGTPTAGVYYSAINPATGALGAWQAGPPLPILAYSYAPGYNMAVLDNALVIVGGLQASGGSTQAIQILTVSADGVAPAWLETIFQNNGALQVGGFATGAGNWDIVQTDITQSTSYTMHVTPVPYLSVPLVATGLTSGNTYHVVLQQHQNATASDYMSWGLLDDTPLPDAALESTRHSGVWATVTAGYSIPMNVYSTSAGGPIYHTYEDPNSYNAAQRTTNLIYNQPYNLPIGLTETTLKPNPPRNANPTFTTGTSPWTVTGATFAQSSAQTQGGYAFSGLFTPNGVAAAPSVQSELFPVSQGGGPFYGASSWYLLDGWLYSPPGDTNVFAYINWFDQGGNALSAAIDVLSLAAATWTHVQVWGEAPAMAAQAQIQIQEAGTPSNAKTIYLSNVYVIQSQECVGAFASASAVEYASPPWPPTGVTQLL